MYVFKSRLKCTVSEAMPQPERCEYCDNKSDNLTRFFLNKPFWSRTKDGWRKTYDLWYCPPCALQFRKDCGAPYAVELSLIHI